VWAAALLLAAGGVLLVAVATRDRPGVTVDSGAYLGAAVGLRDGHGPTSPVMHYDEPYPDHIEVGARRLVTHFPPLYPAAIATVSRLTGLEPLTAARWLGALVMAVTLASITLLVATRTGSLGFGLLAGALALAPDLLRDDSMVWSEGLFGLVLLAGVVLTDRLLRAPSRAVRWALVAVAAAAPLVRFVGVAVPLGVALAVLAFGGGSVWRRGRSAAGLAGVSLVPIAVWVGVSAGVGRGGSLLQWHPPPTRKWFDGLTALGTWTGVTVGPWRWALGVVVLVVLLAVAVVVAVRATDRLVAITLVFAGVLLAVVVLARCTIDALVPFGVRMLSPVHLLAALVVPLAIARVAVPWRHLATAGALLVAAVGVVHSVRDARDFPHENTSYTGERWDRSATMARVRRIPSGNLIVTNAPDAVWLATGRIPLRLPLPNDLFGGGPNRQLAEQTAVLRDALHGRRAIVVFFDRPTQGRHRSLDPRLIANLDLHRTYTYDDGATYRID